MTQLRFYYFNFINHYRNKPDSWAGDFRSLLLVELSMFWLILSIWLLIDPGLRGLGSWTKPIVLVINIVILFCLHRYLMHKGRSEAILKEFKDHPINTSTNRTICWAIWVGTLISFFISASLQP